MLEKNPFSPPVERVPLRLMLDARSFEGLRGEERAKAEFLCELCRTVAIDALWGWEGTPIADGIDATELRAVKDDNRTVGLVGESAHCFIGFVPIWSQFAEWADRCGFEGRDRDWFMYYGPLATFSERNDDHFLVSADPRLLKQMQGDSGWFRKGRFRITSIGGALLAAGNVMKAHGKVIYESPTANTQIHTDSGSIYEYLGRYLVSSRRRLFEAMREDGESKDDFHFSDREALCVSVFDRASDLLRGSDRIALADLRHGSGRLDAVLYDLRATVGNSAGLFDCIAALAEKAFGLAFKRPSEISLGEYNFRKALRAADQCHLASEAQRQAPLLAFVWSLRNPILHQGGLTGYRLHTLGVGESFKATLTEEQFAKLEALCGHRHEPMSQWGADEPSAGLRPSVDPAAFSFRLTVATIQAVDQLLAALADDRGVPQIETTWSSEEKEAITRFRWLAGLPKFESLVSPQA